MSLNKYTQLSYEERVIIENRLKNNESIRSIANKLDRNPSTIAREINRNGIKTKTTRVNKPKELYLDGRHYRGQPQVDIIRTKRDRSYVGLQEQIPGCLEGDTIFGLKTTDRILTHVDRKSGLLSASLIHNYNAHKVTKQTKLDITSVFGKIKSITYDNGIEFSLWKSTEKELNANIYFANPYHSWGRGRNENTNGLIRDFLPKGTDFKKLTKRDIVEITNLINNRPRKRLEWKTPLEVYRSQSVALEGLE